jgi:hypothetical protein
MPFQNTPLAACVYSIMALIHYRTNLLPYLSLKTDYVIHKDTLSPCTADMQ